MGKSTPAAPDYRGAAQETAASDKEALANQTWANRPDQNNPWGNVSWDAQQVRDPATGKMVNQWTQNTTLNEQAQGALDDQLAIQGGRSGLALGMMDRVGGAVSEAADYDQFGDAGKMGGAYNQYYDQNRLNLGGMKGIDQGDINSIDLSGLNAINQGAINSLDLGGLNQVRQGDVGGIRSSQGAVGVYDGGQGLNSAGIQDPTALGQDQGALSISGLQDVGVTQGFNELNTQGLQDVGGAADQRRSAEDSIYGRATSRLDPRFAQQDKDLEISLRNRGLSEGDAAFDAAMDTQNRSRTDAYGAAAMDASIGGGAEAQRNFAMDMQNRQNLFGERGQMSQDAMQQQGQQFGQEMGYRGQQMAERGAQSQNVLQRQGQQFGQQQQIGDTEFARREAIGASDRSDASLQQQQQLARNDQQFGQAQASAGFDLARQQNMFGQDMAMRGQQMDERLAQDSSARTAQQQQYAQDMGMRGMGLDESQALDTSARTAQQQQFGQDMQWNNQQFGQRAALDAASRAGQQQQFQQGMDQTSFNNQQRQQQIQEMLAQRNQPLNEMNAFLSGQQVQAPQFQQFNQAGRGAATDYTGAAQSQYSAGMDSYNAQQQQFQSLMSGLGGAASMFSDRRLKRFIKKIGEISGLAVYTFQYLWSNETVMGFMADEVKAVVPEAVSKHTSGFYMVDYDLTLKTI